ncbi:ABC transporter substrate-binding protein [Ketogulonicigenium vulgare]|uniref:Periplasmic substrate-binding protein, ABC-type iron transporter n=1 Tax=Ketogulonicigenium vulgare (strain WSH-001) TaxID=759362 RepID=F9Y8N1_KETVW|nr:extracellular solute-binding protein [Ketogulonicigenium vulgare]ADO43019.1 putative transporter [Ketogulonicigenium vulgare Y25]AEM41200.1 Periplasmic substrate-binding protein, ABC-type iron transporter [Ketogulonicigenium vulgare WSH-001]ALJ81341.1 iron ABC transporter substrate-binding protein [Ketogulonicigenium vulgare]ANW34075.1 iron ABC transporter substrate-binding protein [Ketogulonicigenium vulgare]AOZ54929.1 transporter [Ketogulonicigenium vulgare]
MKAHKTITRTLCVAAILAGTTSIAFADARADLEAAAAAEGRLIIYSSNQDAEMEAKLAAFEAKYPAIDVDYIRLPSVQVFARFVSEHDAGITQADLLTTASTVLMQERPDLFIPLGPENVPALGEMTPLITPENPNYAVYQTDIQLVTYNNTTVSQDDIAQHLASWEGLADPRWKDQIVIVDPRGSTNQLSFLIGLRNAYGEDWFSGLMANNPQIVNTASSGAQQVAAGAFELMVPSVPVHSAALRGQGAPIGLTLPEGLNHAPAQGTAVPVGASNPNAALLFIDWLLSEEGQALQCRLGGIPTMPVTSADCVNTLPADHMVGMDIIPADLAASTYQLVNLAP